MSAPLAMLDTQPLRQEVSPPHLVVSALLAILAVYQHLTLVDVLHALSARTKPLQATEVHALLALPATRQQEQARLSLQSALFAPLAMEAPQLHIPD